MAAVAGYERETRGVLLGLAASAFACSGLSAQPRDPNAQTSEDVPVGQAVVAGTFAPSARALAQLLLGNFELVALGSFESLPSSERDLVDILKPHDLTIEFRILILYKGPSAQSDVVRVTVNNDMLVFPSGDRSRYAARFAERQRLTTEITSITARLSALEDLRELGDLALSDYEDERARLLSSREQLTAQAAAISVRMVLVSHGDTFYTRGGAIRPSVQYLIGANVVPDNPQRYLLDDLPVVTRNIYWGETAEDIAAALDELMP